VATSGGIAAVQVVDARDRPLAASAGTDLGLSLVSPEQLEAIRSGSRLNIERSDYPARLRVLGRRVGDKTVLVFTELNRVDDSVRILTRAALIGGPLAVLLMATATYGAVTFSLRPVGALRHGAADITAAGLARQRLPVPGAQDEIHRLAVTLNAMLDRIDSATSRQRTFVGDAAHELRSPLASLRVQLEVAQRLGPTADWNALIDDVLVDVDRLDRLVEDLLALARLDESGSVGRREPVRLDELVTSVAGGYVHARVPVRVDASAVTVPGDPDALRRVVINLVDNAVRYATAEVTVTVGPTTREDRTRALLTVEDDGPGIPPAERSKVFDRFYRVQESRSRESGGTGLGLSIVRDIVRNHDGQVRMTERAGGARGLRAVVLLPVAPER
jgi:signal transduction histidine kinase